MVNAKKDYHKEWRMKNIEHLKEYRKKYIKENRVSLANAKIKNRIKKDPDYDYKHLQEYFYKRNPYETIL